MYPEIEILTGKNVPEFQRDVSANRKWKPTYLIN